MRKGTPMRISTNTVISWTGINNSVWLAIENVPNPELVRITSSDGGATMTRDQAREIATVLRRWADGATLAETATEPDETGTD